MQSEPGVNLSDFTVARFFNKANCDCNVPVYIYVTLVQSGFQKRTSVQAGLTTSSSIEFWLGANCADPILRGLTCKLLKQESLIQFLMFGSDTIKTDTQTMSAYVASGVPDAGVFAPEHHLHVAHPEHLSPEHLGARFSLGTVGNLRAHGAAQRADRHDPTA